MQDVADFILDALVIGCGATAFMDIWTLAQKRLLGIASLDYAMVGRWLGHLPNGRAYHDSIAASSAIRGEAALGWIAHYVIGIVFATMLLAIWRPDWAESPTPLPALAVGLATVVAPFLILQPALGAGIAASRTPKQNVSRLKSVITHLSFGLGLYLAAEVWSLLRMAM